MGGSGGNACGSLVNATKLKRQKGMKRRPRDRKRSDREISLRVKGVMEARRWDQRDLAARLELSEGYVSRVLSGHRAWPTALVFRVAEVLEVPVADIDPELDEKLREDVMKMELRRDVPHLATLYTFIHTLPKIVDEDDLHALMRVMEAFAAR